MALVYVNTSPQAGIASLSVAASGAWSLANVNSSWVLDWGDGTTPATGSVASVSGNTGTNNHTYTYAGTFVVAFAVIDGAGNSNTARTTVTVPALAFEPSNWSEIAGKPFVTVTPNGPNDGGDYGPNTPGTSTAGIQEATQQAINSGGGDIIILGPYNYILSKRISVLGSHIHFIGHGLPIVSLANGANDSLFRIGDNINSYTDVTFDSIEFDGNYLNNPSTTPPGILDFEGPPNGTNPTPMSNMAVRRCIIHDAQVRGIYFYCTANSWALENVLYNNLYSIDNNSSFQNFAIESFGNTIEANDIYNQRQDGLITSLMNQCVYAYNSIHNNGKNGLSIDSAFQSTFIGNQIAANAQSGILVFSSISLGGTYNQLLGNQIYANGQHGIILNTQASRTMVLANMLRSNSQSAGGIYDEIHSAGSYTQIEGNHIVSDTPVRSRYNIAEVSGAKSELIQGNWLGGGGSGLLSLLGNVGTKVGKNIGLNAVLSTTPFDTTNNLISALGTGSTGVPVASTDYSADLSDQITYVSGGTGVSIVLKDSAGTVFSTGLTTPQTLFLAWGTRVNFGAFTVAPTVTSLALI